MALVAVKGRFLLKSLYTYIEVYEKNLKPATSATRKKLHVQEGNMNEADGGGKRAWFAGG